MADSEQNSTENTQKTILLMIKDEKRDDDGVTGNIMQGNMEKHKSNAVNVVENPGGKQVNNFPDSPISMAESDLSNDVSTKQGRKRKVSVCLQEGKRSRRKRKDNIYEVEYILDYAEYESDAFYLVKWKDWEPKYNSWEPRENVTNCKKIIDEYFASVYVSSTNTRENIDAYGWSLLNPTRQSLEELIASLVQKGKVKYEVPSLRKVCMALNSLLSVPESDRQTEMLENVKRDLMLRCFHVKRIRQLKLLKEWQNEINAASSADIHITVENEVDLEGPPENFYYCNEYVEGQGVSIPNEPPIGCNCKFCDPETCSCVKESGNDFAYHPDSTVKVFSRVPIYECNKLCQCSDKCINRVVQKGCRVKLSIFRTATGCGWGVKALQNIPKGTFVCEYVGEVINSEEAEKRGKEYDAVGQTYLFDLDFNDREQCPYTVDAALLGNISHFINHSCNPNLAVYAVWINCLDPDLPKLAFFARKTIQANDEITFDYNSQALVTKVSSSQTPCKCSSLNCRKYLF